MKKLDQLFTWEHPTLEGRIEEIHKKVVPLINLVNSQQEAIEKLREDMRPYTEEEISKMSFWPNREKGEIAMGEKISGPADNKATITTVGIVENGKAIGWEFDCRGKIPGMTFNADGTQLIAGYTIEELKKIADDKPVSCRKCMTNTHIELCCPKSDTHRTVTLRIPKGMRIVEALDEVWRSVYSTQWWSMSDTDLQKALDEVEHE